MNEPTPRSRFFHVYITLPPKEGESKYSRNLTLGVAAETLQDAVIQVEKLYPGASIWTITHRGAIHHGILEVGGINGGCDSHDEERPKGVKW